MLDQERRLALLNNILQERHYLSIKSWVHSVFELELSFMIVLWVVSRWITKPLWQLAQSAKALDAPDATRTIMAVHGWYFEAFQIKNAILQGLASINRKMGKLNLENITDPLTNLVNRRGMEIALDEWQALQQPFAVIMADNRSLQSD